MSKGLDQEVYSDFVRALAFPSRKHSRQRRKDADASPYINHPIALVSILAVEAGIADRDTLCAALLDDTIEDTDTPGLASLHRFPSTHAPADNRRSHKSISINAAQAQVLANIIGYVATNTAPPPPTPRHRTNNRGNHNAISPK